MAVKALVIDLDGTLYHHEKELSADIASARRIERYIARHRPRKIGKQLSERERKRLIGQRKLSALILRTCEAYDVSREGLSRYAYDIDPADYGIGKDARLTRLLEKAARRYRLFLFTNGYPNWVRKVLKAIGISKFFNHKNTVHMGMLIYGIKPSAGAFRVLADAAGVDTGEMLLIDDSAKNVAAAKRLGMKAVLAQGSDGMPIYAILEELCKGAES